MVSMVDTADNMGNILGLIMLYLTLILQRTEVQNQIQILVYRSQTLDDRSQIPDGQSRILVYQILQNPQKDGVCHRMNIIKLDLAYCSLLHFELRYFVAYEAEGRNEWADALSP